MKYKTFWIQQKSKRGSHTGGRFFSDMEWHLALFENPIKISITFDDKRRIEWWDERTLSHFSCFANGKSHLKLLFIFLFYSTQLSHCHRGHSGCQSKRQGIMKLWNCILVPPHVAHRWGFFNLSVAASSCVHNFHVDVLTHFPHLPQRSCHDSQQPATMRANFTTHIWNAMEIRC